ncbi:MAG TPA: ATP-binding protein [Luteimonas sp.]
MPPEAGTRRPRALLAWSGGKDAAWALQVMREQGEVEVCGLLSTITEGDDRASMQGLRVEILRAQAAAAGLPLVECRLPRNCDNTRYEARFSAALDEARARWPGIDRIAFGDLQLADIRAWREALTARLGWTPMFPLFGADTATLARTMVDRGLRASLCCVDTTRLPVTFAGRPFDAALLDALPPGVDPCGEAGEFHTCVQAGPMFDAPVDVTPGALIRDGVYARTDFVLGA